MVILRSTLSWCFCITYNLRWGSGIKRLIMDRPSFISSSGPSGFPESIISNTSTMLTFRRLMDSCLNSISMLIKHSLFFSMSPTSNASASRPCTKMVEVKMQLFHPPIRIANIACVIWGGFCHLDFFDWDAYVFSFCTYVSNRWMI